MPFSHSSADLADLETLRAHAHASLARPPPKTNPSKTIAPKMIAPKTIAPKINSPKTMTSNVI